MSTFKQKVINIWGKKGEIWLAQLPSIIGEKVFEAAAFDLIDQDSIQETKTIHGKIISRASQLAEALHVSYERLLSWIFLRIIISAQWFIEDNDCPNEMLMLANYLYPIIKNLPLSLKTNHK